MAVYRRSVGNQVSSHIFVWRFRNLIIIIIVIIVVAIIVTLLHCRSSAVYEVSITDDVDPPYKAATPPS